VDDTGEGGKKVKKELKEKVRCGVRGGEKTWGRWFKRSGAGSRTGLKRKREGKGGGEGWDKGNRGSVQKTPKTKKIGNKLMDGGHKKGVGDSKRKENRRG